MRRALCDAMAAPAAVGRNDPRCIYSTFEASDHAQKHKAHLSGVPKAPLARGRLASRLEDDDCRVGKRARA